MTQQIHHPELLAKIDAFLAETGMGQSYFGKQATKNSEVVARLRSGKRIWPETEAALLAYMAANPARSQEQGAA